jgi:N-methylhydantoinase B/oxoprolinase/acetone carboxylase alpha subunit
MKVNSKAKFSSSEDELLKELIKRFGTNSWIKIKQYFSNRTTRQLRERWRLYLNPCIHQNP